MSDLMGDGSSEIKVSKSNLPEIKPEDLRLATKDKPSTNKKKPIREKIVNKKILKVNEPEDVVFTKDEMREAVKNMLSPKAIAESVVGVDVTKELIGEKKKMVSGKLDASVIRNQNLKDYLKVAESLKRGYYLRAANNDRVFMGVDLHIDKQDYVNSRPVETNASSF